MSHPSCKMSLRYNRTPSALSRPKSAVGLLGEEHDMMFEGCSSSPRPHTSFHYYPEDEDPELGGYGHYGGHGDHGSYGHYGGYEDHGGCGHSGGYGDYGGYGDRASDDPRVTARSGPEDPRPLKLVKTYGYGYRSKSGQIKSNQSCIIIQNRIKQQWDCFLCSIGCIDLKL